MKHIIRTDLKVALLITFVWSIMGPYTSVLKGLLEEESVAAFMIAGSAAMEFLTVLNKHTTFKSSTRHLIIFDIIYIMSIILSYNYLSDRGFIIAVMAMTIPYWPLVRNVGNKYRALVGERYPKYFVESLFTKISILNARVGTLALALAGVVSIVSIHPSNVVIVFIVISAIQSAWSIYAYRKYYHIFPR